MRLSRVVCFCIERRASVVPSRGSIENGVGMNQLGRLAAPTGHTAIRLDDSKLRRYQ